VVDFTLTDEQKALREMAHDFAVKEIRPVAWEYDRDGTWPAEVLRKAWEVGLMNSHVPEEYGGPGASYLDGCIIEEELSWGCSGAAPGAKPRSARATSSRRPAPAWSGDPR
jgi:acyl-CoA dehydrogenase